MASSMRAYIRYYSGEICEEILDVVAVHIREDFKLTIFRKMEYGRHIYGAIHAPTEYMLASGWSSIPDLIRYLDREWDWMYRYFLDHIERHCEYHGVDTNPEGGWIEEGWRAREFNRMLEGEYAPLPAISGLKFPKDHYVHLSVDHPGTDMVAYTPSATHGERDRQVALKFGKYLRKVFPEMDDKAIQRHVTKFRVSLRLDVEDVKLKFATDRSTINEIFETRMYARGSSDTSCMYGKFYNWPNRPYHVYADSPDVAVAYLEIGGAIAARSVVSTKDKTWIRAYSIESSPNETECGLLINMLEKEGYTEGDLMGNRLTNVDHGGEVILPYLDGGEQYVRESGKCWVVCGQDSASYEACRTDGTGDAMNTCEYCEESEDNCECTHCECCGRIDNDGCELCDFCIDCETCVTHHDCECEEEEEEEEEEEAEEEVAARAEAAIG